ncbi:MAG TPA: hypothetical protein VMG81_03355 [Thermoplasmata archaeon]|nr:hypothetical protein [Thermoplasmata archaeon]
MAARAVPAQRAGGPDVLRRGTLTELAQRLERLKATTKDVVADTTAVTMSDDAEIFVPTIGRLPLTPYAHTQLAEKTAIPQRYYDKMLGANPALLAQNVNAWMPTRERRLFRAADGKVRAILSDKFRAIDNYDVALLVAERAADQGAEVTECSLTETRMYLKLSVPGHAEVLGKLTEVQIAEAKRRGLFGPDGRNTHFVRPDLNEQLTNDWVVPSLTVSNSEVGAGAYRVEPGVRRLVCFNLAVADTALHQVHLGARLESGEIDWSAETRRLSDAALASQVKDAIDAVFNRDTFRGMVARMTAAKEVAIEQPVDVTEAVSVKLGLSDDRKQALLRYFAIEGYTAFGMGQAVARLAQDAEGADDQVELERQAGIIIAKPDEVLALA